MNTHERIPAVLHWFSSHILKPEPARPERQGLSMVRRDFKCCSYIEALKRILIRETIC